MKQIIRICLIITALFISSFASAQHNMHNLNLNVDYAVRIGKLDNGLTYFIRKNSVPAKKINMYLAHKNGSILEEDNQNGFSELIGRLAFCGTKNFPDDSMISFFETNGMSYGKDVNKNIAQDYQIFNICNINSEEKHIVDSCMMVLYDWANFISLNTDNIERERHKLYMIDSVRYSKAEKLFRSNILPQMFPNCRYGKRTGINLCGSVINADSKDLRNFYYTWYRPDLQALVIIGDVDVDETENYIKNTWSDTPVDTEPMTRYYVQVEDNDKPLAAVVCDSAFTCNVIEINYKQDVMPVEFKHTYPGYVNEVVNKMISMIITERLYYLSKEPGAKFTYASGSYGSYLSAMTKDALNFEAVYENGDWEPAMKQILAAINSFKEYGFTDGEYCRAKDNVMKYLSNELNNYYSKDNSQYAQECIDYFIKGTPMPGIEARYKACEKIVNNIPISQLNNIIKGYIGEKNIAMFILDRTDDLSLTPDKDDLINIYNEEMNRPASVYIDRYMEGEPNHYDLKEITVAK